ncbi:MAG: rhomboid family intramembrane serine protease [Candidatus Nanopelagicales bacterium]
MSVPVCYRHPDRETYIRCTRCERPICPDCMTSAAVGFQCPECVAEGRASTPDVVSVLGTKPAERPLVVMTLIGLNVLAYVVQLTSGTSLLTGLDNISTDYGMWPRAIAVEDQFYRLITATFLHASLWHIGFNMLVLWMLGPQLEQILGHLRFTVLYLVAGLGGSVASFWFSGIDVFGVGASGAIFGLMGAYVVVGKKLRADITQVIGLIAINVVIGFVVGGIDWRAHLGGLAVGAAVAAVFAFLPRKPVVQVVAVLVIVGVLVAAVVARDAAITANLASITGGT